MKQPSQNVHFTLPAVLSIARRIDANTVSIHAVGKCMAVVLGFAFFSRSLKKKKKKKKGQYYHVSYLTAVI